MDILKRELNDEQLAITRNLDGNVLVIAGPGSGKTRLLVHRVGFVLRSKADPPTKALCLTFTNEAAKELASRLQPITPPFAKRLVWCGNFHQFGQFLLSKYGHLLGISRSFEVIDEFQAADILAEVLNDLGVKNVKPLDLFYSISRFRGRVNPPSAEELAEVGGRFGEILDCYAEAKRLASVMDFDDLIEVPIQLLRSQPSLRALLRDVYRNLFVDELQDTSLLQLELLKELFDPERSSIFGVADEDQILYEWRDARLATIREFEQFFSARTEFLVLNHRSPQEIVDVANALISQNPERYDKELRSAVNDRTGKVWLFHASDPDQEAERVADRIVSGVRSGLRSKSDYVVLARIASSLEPIKRALKSREVAAVHIGDRTVSGSPTTRLIKAAMAVAGGRTNGEKRLQPAIDSLNSAAGKSALSLPVVMSAVESSRQPGPSAFIERLSDRLGLSHMLAGSRMSDHLEIARKVVLAAMRDGATGYDDLALTLALEWNRLECLVLRSEDSVKLMTVHQAKGLEFPVVHVIRLEDGLFPLIRRGSRPNIPEERRLLFVAITRAEEEIVLSICATNDRGWASTPSRFFDDIAECETNELDFSASKKSHA